MEARIDRAVLLAAALTMTLGASYPTRNFVVRTADPKLAEQFAETAERFRHDLAITWLGAPMPNWPRPCVMTVHVGEHLGAGGATTFVFDRGEVFGWVMTIQGSVERILDSVLPHEITHMIFACHFRRPLPRWADEGAATSVEAAGERAKQRSMLSRFLAERRGIAFSEMFAMTEYPDDILPLYAQGYTLAEFLIQKGGRKRFLDFLGQGMGDQRWSAAVASHYGYGDLQSLQDAWVGWAGRGFPRLQPLLAETNTPPAASAPPELLAQGQRSRPEPNLIHRIRKVDPQAGPGGRVGSHLNEGYPRDPSAGPPSHRSREAGAHRRNWSHSVPGQKLVATVPRGSSNGSAKSAWHPLGERPVEAAPTATPPTLLPGPVRTEAARPQPIARPHQTILKWQRRGSHP